VFTRGPYGFIGLIHTLCAFVWVSFSNVRRQSLRDIWEAIAEFAHPAKPRGQRPMNQLAFRGEFVSASWSAADRGFPVGKEQSLWQLASS